MYYESKGLIPKPRRNESNYRIYSEDTTVIIRFVKKAQHLGFTLKEIQELLSFRSALDSDCNRIRSMAGEKISDIDGRINSLKRMKKALAVLQNECVGGNPVSSCPIIESLESGEED